MSEEVKFLIQKNKPNVIAYHNGAANLSFADGHVEGHRWVLEDTRRPSVKGGAGGTFVPSGAIDYDWLKERTSVRK